MAAVSAFGWINMVKTAGLSATSAETALPVTNLTGDLGAASTAWQSLAGALTPVLTVTPTVRTTVRAVGVFRSNATAAATVIARAYTNPGAVLVATAPTATFANGQAIALFAADVAADIVTLTFADAANPDGHLNIPLVFIGPLWFPATSLSWATTIGRDDVSDTVVSRGGQTYINMRSTYRRLELALDGIRFTEAYANLDVLDRYSRIGGNVLVLPDYTSANLPYEATYGLLKATADVAFPYPTIQRRSWRARLTERL